MSVIDASAVVRLLLGFPRAEAAEPYVFDSAERQVAPDLLNVEVLHALRRFERLGVIDVETSAAAVERLAQLPIVRYPTATLLDRAWSLRHNFTAYDAMYVALAEALDSPLVTADGHLARAVRDHSTATAIELTA